MDTLGTGVTALFVFYLAGFAGFVVGIIAAAVINKSGDAG